MKKKFYISVLLILSLLLIPGCSQTPEQDVPAELSPAALPNETPAQEAPAETPDEAPIGEPLPDAEPFPAVTRLSTAGILAEIAGALPDDWSCGEYDITLGGHGGGIPVYDSTGAPVGFIEQNHAASPAFHGGVLAEVGDMDNHADFISPFTALDSSVPCIYAGYSMDIYDDAQGSYTGTEESWYIFWAKEGCQPVYAAKLLKSAIGQEEIALFATGVEIPESAFSQG